MEQKGLRVNMKKTKFLISGTGLNVLKDTGKYPCAVCRKGVGANSINCSSCQFWVHKKCSGIQGHLSADPEFVCSRCRGTARPIDGRPVSGIPVDNTMLELESEFCYLGDMLSANGGCMQAIIARCNAAWGKFKKLLPILTSRHISPSIRGKVFNVCVRSAMLHGSETWAPTAADLQRLRRNDRAMIRWMAGVRLRDEISSASLLARFGLIEISSVLRSRRLRWHGHVARSANCIHTVTEMVVPGSRGRGRPRKTWKECLKRDIMECGLSDTDPLDRVAWRAGVRACQLLPTPVSGKGAAV